MTLKEDAKVLGSAILATVVSLTLGAASALWIDRVVAPVLRGTDWDWLLFLSVVLLVGGHGYVWYRIYCWTLERLDRIA